MRAFPVPNLYSNAILRLNVLSKTLNSIVIIVSIYRQQNKKWTIRRRRNDMVESNEFMETYILFIDRGSISGKATWPRVARLDGPAALGGLGVENDRIGDT